MYPPRSLARGLLRVALLLLGPLAGVPACRPEAALPPPRAGSPPPAAWPAPAPAGAFLNTAPGVSILHTSDLQNYLVEVLENHALKQTARWALAMEPDEAEEEVVPLLHSIRYQKDIEPIEAYFNAGEELFETELTVLRGFGDAMGGKAPNFHRVHRGAHGGPDSTSCRSCHHRGGDDGAGEFNEAALTGGDGDSERNANERNPPALGGGGAVQILAHEITAVLQEQVKNTAPGAVSELHLIYQDVDFGVVRIRADGQIDTSALTAIDPDLVVRPFGWKGTHSTLRRFAEEAFQVHHGMQSSVLLERRRAHGADPRESSPTTRAVLQALGDGPIDDPDKDGVGVEVGSLQLSAIAVYLSLLPMPVIEPPRAPDLLAAWRTGGAVFNRIGCASCHKPMWTVREPVWVEHPEEDTYTRVRLELDLRKHIRNGPPLRNHDTLVSGYPIFLFSDLRRHDMGPTLADHYSAGSAKEPKKEADPHPDLTWRERQVPPSYFLTRPLWGLGESAPYMHDGRSLTLDDAILIHGGEAQKTRDAYAALPVAEQRALQVFLLSLTRPPLPEVLP